MMASKSPSLNSLMNYRFVKKQVPKLTSGSESLFSSDTNGGIQHDSKGTDGQTDSQTSNCSSATILYSDQEGGSQNSEMTIPYNPSQDLGSQDPFTQNTEGRGVSDAVLICLIFIRGISESQGVLCVYSLGVSLGYRASRGIEWPLCLFDYRLKN